MIADVIDVWDSKTFDPKLSAVLSSEAGLIRNYMLTDHEIFLSYDHSRDPHRPILRPENPYSWAFLEFAQAIAELMNSRTIRAWHYTRLMDEEVNEMQIAGIHLSTPDTLRSRLNYLAGSGAISMAIANSLYSASPFHQKDQMEARIGKFWMASHPVAIDDPGVTRLLRYWGGEVTSFWNKDTALLMRLEAIGKARIIELAVPLAVTQKQPAAGDAVVATFARHIGCIPGKHAFDLCSTAPLSAASVLSVLSEGDVSFQSVGRGYPEGYIDVGIGYWKELTGEDD